MGSIQYLILVVVFLCQYFETFRMDLTKIVLRVSVLFDDLLRRVCISYLIYKLLVPKLSIVCNTHLLCF